MSDINIDVIDQPILVDVINSPGAAGVGVPVGGSTGQVLAKTTATNYDTQWVNQSVLWGNITGTLSGQTDLQNALNAKFDDPTGTTLQYLRGDGTLATFPTITSGTVTSVGLTSATSGVTIGSSPITSSGNITLAISTASGSVNGLLSSTDWTTFNSKQNLLTNPITGTAASGQVAYFTGATTQAGNNNLFWNSANNRLGILTNTPICNLDVSGDARITQSLLVQGFNPAGFIGAGLELYHTGGVSNIQSFNRAGNAVLPMVFLGSTITFKTGNPAVDAMRIFASTNNVLIQNGGTFTDSGQRLQVTGDTLLKGSGATSATAALTVQDSGGTAMVTIRNDGILKLQKGYLNVSSDINILVGASNDGASFNINGLGIIYGVGNRTSAGVNHGLYGNNITNTTGLFQHISSTLPNFIPTSGTGTFIIASLQAVINQTGGANGITRGLYVNPTLTAAADWRSIEWSNNTGWGLYGAGTAANYLNGNLGVGVLPSAWGGSFKALQVGLGTSLYNNTTYNGTFLGSNFFYNGTNNIYLSSTTATAYGQVNGQHQWFNAPSGSFGNVITFTQAMTLTAVGRLILGAGDSGELLQVNGTAKITGDASVNGVNIGIGGGSITSNTRVGLNSLNANTTGFNNTAVGLSALINNTTGSNNVAIGASALLNNTTANSNTAIGRNALTSNTTGIENTAIGLSALQTNTIGFNNTAIGVSSLLANTTGENNTGIGKSALTNNTIGNLNTAAGQQSMGTNTTGGSNTAYGRNSLFNNTTGDNNVAIGIDSGRGATPNTTGSNNIFIGQLAVGVSSTDSNRTWIGNSSTTSTWLGGSLILGTTTTNASAILQADSTTKGLLPPRMTTVQKNAIATPAAGLMVYDTTLNQMSYYNATIWINF